MTLYRMRGRRLNRLDLDELERLVVLFRRHARRRRLLARLLRAVLCGCRGDW